MTLHDLDMYLIYIICTMIYQVQSFSLTCSFLFLKINSLFRNHVDNLARQNILRTSLVLRLKETIAAGRLHHPEIKHPLSRGCFKRNGMSSNHYFSGDIFSFREKAALKTPRDSCSMFFQCAKKHMLDLHSKTTHHKILSNTPLFVP